MSKEGTALRRAYFMLDPRLRGDDRFRVCKTCSAELAHPTDFDLTLAGRVLIVISTQGYNDG